MDDHTSLDVSGASTLQASTPNGTASGHESYSQETIDCLTGTQARLPWEDLDYEDRLEHILGNPAFDEWLQPPALETLMHFRPIPWKWAEIKAVYKRHHGNPWDLEKAVDALLLAERGGAPAADTRPRPVVTTMDTVEAQPITWLWWPYIGVGKLCMLDGDPGVGKSLLMTQIAASLSRGDPLPDQQGQPTLPTDSPHATLLLSTEDGLADTLKPRLVAAAADCSKVHVLTGRLGPEEEFHTFTLQHIGVLETAIKSYRPRLVVIDPIQAYLGPIDMHRANETRPLLQALTRLAEQYHCAIVCIRHPSKPGQGTGKAIHRGLGSVDFIGAARTGLFVEQHPVDPGKGLLCQHKSNLGPLGQTQIFSKSEGQFHWCGVTRLPVELIAGDRRGPDPMAFIEAFCWLEQRLAEGRTWPASDIETEALEQDHKKDTIRRAKKALGVVSTKMAGSSEGGWTWRLPPLAHVPPPETTSVTSASSPSSVSSPSSPSREQSAEIRTPGQDTEVTEEREVTEVVV